MTDKEYLELQERYYKANKLRAYLKKCDEKIIEMTRNEAKAKPLSKTKENYAKSIIYWIDRKRETKQEYHNL